MTRPSNVEPKISVIVPVYQAEPYLRKCLESIVNQAYTNLEIILVDDGSLDNSGAICDAYAAGDERVLAVHQANCGAAAARNVGLELATGEYIGFVDSDDWIEPDMFSYLLSKALEYKADMVQCGMFWEEKGDKKSVFTLIDDVFLAGDAEKFSLADWRLLSNQIYNKLYRADVVRGISFAKEYPIGEDLHFNLQALRRIEATVFVKEAKYHYWQRADSLCHNVSDIRSLFSLRSVLRFASNEFGGMDAARTHFQEQILRDDLDICSKLARLEIAGNEGHLDEIRAELRGCFFEAMFNRVFTLREKLKVALIVWMWPVYKSLLRLLK